MPNSIEQAPASELARAKVNLALHVTGQREDGYHLLDSLVVFPEIGDRLSLTRNTAAKLTISGPFSDGLDGDTDDNLVTRASGLLSASSGLSFGGTGFHLEKNLPIASGIGGGSADAAAAIRLLIKTHSPSLTQKEISELALQLGADVPVCLPSEPAIMRGIGEELEAAPTMPDCTIILVNPNLAVSTPAVFKGLTAKTNPPLPAHPEAFTSLDDLASWLTGTRNDLEPAAIAVCPQISEVLDCLNSQESVAFARMSGSGATCFALCKRGQEEKITHCIAASHPNWWVAAGRMN